MGFGKSFDEAFKPANASATASSMDMIKEKIKLDTVKATEVLETNANLSAVTEYGKFLPKEQQDQLAMIVAMKNHNKDTSKSALSLAESFLKPKDELTQAIKQQNLIAIENKNSGEILPPSIQNVKNKRTEEIFTTFELNKVKKDQADQVEVALSAIPKGLVGKAQVNYFKNLSPDSPVLSGWQNMKDMLSEIQLDKVSRTKGAISDAEMEFFKLAVGNDDLTSIPRLTPIIAKYRKGMEAKERALTNSFKQSFKEDPAEWDQLKQFFGDKSATTHESKMPSKSSAPKGAKGWDTDKNEWVF